MPHSGKLTLKASLTENSQLLDCKLRFGGAVVVWCHEVMYRHARRTTTKEDLRGNSRPPVLRFSFICDNRKFGDMGHRSDRLLTEVRACGSQCAGLRGRASPAHNFKLRGRHKLAATAAAMGGRAGIIEWVMPNRHQVGFYQEGH
jgi:hypothetical protein